MCKGKSVVTLGARIHKCSERPHVVRGVCLKQRVAARDASHVTCHLAHVTHVTCHTSHVTCNTWWEGAVRSAIEGNSDAAREIFDEGAGLMWNEKGFFVVNLGVGEELRQCRRRGGQWLL
jgi:hypothetical protein